MLNLQPQISVVVPIHNEGDNLEEFHSRIQATLSGLALPFEIIYVDDGSTDRSLEILLDLQRREPAHLVVMELYRNYGQFRAIAAGFERVRGEVVVTLDADLQNPPEEIPSLVAFLQLGGYDVVNGWRRRRHDSWFRRLASWMANRIAARLTGVRIHDYGCMLRAYRRDLVLQVAAYQEHSPYLPTLANALARRAGEIEVAHAPRRGGRSKYSLRKLIQLQLDMLTSGAAMPLRWLGALGMVICSLALVGGAGMMTGPLLGIGLRFDAVRALLVVLLLLVGVLFLTLALVGEYVGRIHNEVRRRPRFVVREVHEGRRAPSTRRQALAGWMADLGDSGYVSADPEQE